jgi:hypothetical protein
MAVWSPLIKRPSKVAISSGMPSRSAWALTPR